MLVMEYHLLYSQPMQVNSLILSKAKNELPLFVTHLKEIIDEQQREVERATTGTGKYQFCEEYKYLEIPESKWFQMSRQQRQKHFEKVLRVKLDNHTNSENELAPAVSWDIMPDW